MPNPEPQARESKSDRTRAAILEAAQTLFAERGYEKTTIRDVAARAAIDPAMVMRYFGSKDELFARAATFDLNLPDLSGVRRDDIGDTLIRHFFDLWEGDAGAGLTILLRSAASNAYAAEKTREIFAAQVLPAIARAGEAPDAGVRAGLIGSQLLGLALCRYVLKIPPLAAAPSERLIAEIGPTLQRYAVESLA